MVFWGGVLPIPTANRRVGEQVSSNLVKRNQFPG